MKRALITGITGQDGSYLAELLLSKGYRIYATSHTRLERQYINISHFADSITFIDCDVADKDAVMHAVRESRPDEVYNLAAVSSKTDSFKDPLLTAEVNGFAVAYFLESLRKTKPAARFFQASSALVLEAMNFDGHGVKYDSPYSVAKSFAQLTVQLYREYYGIFASCGILYNHESPRRGTGFVSRKITSTVADIIKGKTDCLVLGGLDSYRDWGFAEDYVRAMWMILQADTPDDYTIATGESHSVREFVCCAFKYVDIDIVFSGSGAGEVGQDAKTGRVLLKISPELYRPNDAKNVAVGETEKIYNNLGWKPDHFCK